MENPLIVDDFPAVYPQGFARPRLQAELEGADEPATQSSFGRWQWQDDNSRQAYISQPQVIDRTMGNLEIWGKYRRTTIERHF